MDKALFDAILAADVAFSTEFGIEENFVEYDAALMLAVVEFNQKNGSEFDPYESIHQYFEEQERHVCG